MKSEIFTKRFIKCPHCGKGESAVEHLLSGPDRSFGPWHCEECGGGYKGSVKNGEIEVNLLGADQRITKDRFAILRVKGTPLFIIYDHSDYDDEHWRARDDFSFLFEDHECPINVFHDAEAIIWNGNEDDHSMIEFVGMIQRNPKGIDLMDWLSVKAPEVIKID